MRSKGAPKTGLALPPQALVHEGPVVVGVAVVGVVAVVAVGGSGWKWVTVVVVVAVGGSGWQWVAVGGSG